jgi:hypothetical protein
LEDSADIIWKYVRDSWEMDYLEVREFKNHIKPIGAHRAKLV